MDMELCAPDKNFESAKALIRKAAKENPDVIVLPEMWNTGFFPRENLVNLADSDGERTKTEIGALAKELSVNIVAGSVANVKCGKVYNTAYVFDREGSVCAEYDKTHLFTPMNEHGFFERGSRVCRFELDGKMCGIIICYDLRFPELIRTMSVQGLDLLFAVSQWPDVRIPHLLALLRARAIENQMFVACANSCGRAGETVYGGSSAVFDPWGEELARAGEREEIISAECDTGILNDIRRSINVFCDRRADLYKLQ